MVQDLESPPQRGASGIRLLDWLDSDTLWGGDVKQIRGLCMGEMSRSYSICVIPDQCCDRAQTD